MLYDNNDRLIGVAGCNIIIHHKVDYNSYRQEFIKVDGGKHSSYPQISAIAMSHDRRLLVVGTSSDHAKILVWDIGSQTSLYDLILMDII